MTLLDSPTSSRDQWIRCWSTDPVELLSDAYREHAEAVMLRARSVCGAHDAADVTQEVFLRLWRNPAAFDPDKGSLRTYLLVLARGVAIDFVRSDSRRRSRDERAHPFVGIDDPSVDITVVDAMIGSETADRISAALARLDAAQRETIETAFFGGLSYTEIARRSGVPEGTVKSRVRLGLQRMRPVLVDLCTDDKKKRRLARTTRNREPVSVPRSRRAPRPRRAQERSRAALTTVLAGSLIVASCGSGGARATAADGRIAIATTVAPITSIVASVVGDRADVVGLVPEGTNSHTFEPLPSAAELLSTVDVVYMNGLSLEVPTRMLAESNLRAGSDIVELGTLSIPAAEYIYDFSFPIEDGKPNPHLWTDPTLARRYAEIVKDDMSERDPGGADYFAANYAKFSARIDELDAAMRTAFATIESRQLLTYHDAYAYFAETYDWDVIGAIQISDFEDPTPSEVADLIDQVRASGVPAIFGSEVFPSPVLEQIGREAGVEYVDELRDDDLPGEPGDVEHSWLGLMLFDYITLTEALGGDASALRSLTVSDVVLDEAEYPQ